MTPAKANMIRLLMIVMVFVMLLMLWPACISISAQSGFGYGVAVQLWGQDPEPVINGVAGMGFDWLRQAVRWADVEPVEGQYYWEPLDILVAAVGPFRIKVLVAIYDAPDWALDDGGSGLPVRLDALSAFLTEMATRYRGRIAAYEIWPGVNRAGSNGISPAGYAILLQTAYNALKTSDPMCVVVSGGLEPVLGEEGVNGMDDVAYLTELYRAGGGQWFDVLGVHLNGYDNPPDALPGSQGGNFEGSQRFFLHYEELRQVMVEYGDAEAQMWLTMVGWASADGSGQGYVTEEQQAEYLVRAFEIASHEPFVGLMVVNNFNYATLVPAGDIMGAFSLLRPDWTARPAFMALARMRQSVRVWDEAPIAAERHSADAMPDVPD